MVLLFIGPSGGGKDTQAELLVEGAGVSDNQRFERVSTGDLIRDISEGEHEIQRIIREKMNKGFLEDKFTIGLLQIYLSELRSENVILSGAIRQATQIKLLDQALALLNRTLDKVILFEISDKEAIKRMSGRLYCPIDNSNYHLIFNPPRKVDTCDLCGTKLQRREDDNPEAIKARLAEFHKESGGIISEYENRGILIRIDASKDIDSVHKSLIKKLNL